MALRLAAAVAQHRLLGHEAAEKTMLAAHASGRLHHAWLMAGPRGIGKATLAWRFARFLLCGQQQGGLFGGGAAEGLDVAADAPGRSLVDARSHPDLFHLRRTLNPDTGRMRAEIAVDDVRELGAFMHMTPAMGQWRVAIVDFGRRDEPQQRQRGAEGPRGAAAQRRAADRGARAGSAAADDPFALPKARPAPACRRHHDAPAGRLRARGEGAGEGGLARLAEGSIGRALELAGAGSLELYSEMVSVLATLPELDMRTLAWLRRALCAPRRGGECGLALAELPVRRLAEGPGAAIGTGRRSCTRRAIGARPAGALLAAASLDRWMEAWENAARLFARADAVNLDRKQTVLATFLSLQSAMR